MNLRSPRGRCYLRLREDYDNGFLLHDVYQIFFKEAVLHHPETSRVILVPLCKVLCVLDPPPLFNLRTPIGQCQMSTGTTTATTMTRSRMTHGTSLSLTQTQTPSRNGSFFHISCSAAAAGAELHGNERKEFEKEVRV